MLRNMFTVAILAAAGLAYPALGQSRGGPAELPPAGFAGQQYVDSRGCVFLRAGHGGREAWVRRVGADRKPMCGYPPTRQVMAQAQGELSQTATAPAPAPTPAPAAGGRRPMDTVASTTEPPRIQSAAAPRSSIPASQYAPPRVVMAAAPAATAAPAARVAAAPTPAPSPTPAPAPTVAQAPKPAAALAPVATPILRATAGCPDNAPYGQNYHLTDGRMVLVCTATGRTFTGLRPGDVARAVAASDVRVSKSDPRLPETTVPKGYKPAWTDDRLNPHRGIRTAQGDAQMRRIWTDEVPQRLQVEAAPQQRARVTASTKTAPAAPARAAVRAAVATTGAFVQVGSFGVAENASRAAGKLQAMGLPVQVQRAAIKGKPVQIVRAGPFASRDDASAALAAARRAGFADAILRN